MLGIPSLISEIPPFGLLPDSKLSNKSSSNDLTAHPLGISPNSED